MPLSSPPITLECMIFSVPSQMGYSMLGVLIFGESAGLPIPGETALIVAGGLTAGGHLSLLMVIAIGALAATVGDTLGYWLGRRGGRAFLLRDGLAAAHRRRTVERADRYFLGHGTVTVFLGRWVPGLRYMSALMAGATRMPWKRFAIANAAGALAWTATVSTLARVAGPAGSVAFSIGGLAVGAIALAVAWRKRRRTTPASV
jgi:membrane protein DedA with SNARE-associated domain